MFQTAQFKIRNVYSFNQWKSSLFFPSYRASNFHSGNKSTNNRSILSQVHKHIELKIATNPNLIIGIRAVATQHTLYPKFTNLGG